ncbi:MAG: glycosyltransferase [Actinomycetota bacterium]|nr:glycosyltransferase [Actinomycetota bacterium]
MTKECAISLLMASYNPGRYLIPAVESIADQVQEGDELLIQDALSTDGSLEALLKRFPALPWLKVVSESDDGQADGLDRALNRAKNDYVMWLNADDVIYPGALKAVRRALEDRPDLVIGRSTIFNNDGRIVRSYAPRAFTREAFVGRGADLFTGSIAYRTQLMREVGGFDAKYVYCMDIDLFARLSERKPSAVYIPEVLAGLRWHSKSKGGTTVLPIVSELHQVRMEHARTARERAIARVSTACYLAAAILQPIRHSKTYSALRAKLVREQPAPVSVSSMAI